MRLLVDRDKLDPAAHLGNLRRLAGSADQQALGEHFGLGHGHVDFAGSSVVHMVGGVTALAGAWILGPRLGKFNKDGSANALPAHNIPMALTGAFILAFGWFGFNAGSALAARKARNCSFFATTSSCAR